MTDDDLDRRILTILARLGPRATLRNLTDQLHRSHRVIGPAWDRLIARGLAPPRSRLPGPPRGTVSEAGAVLSDDEIAARCREIRSKWPEDDPRLAGRWRVPTGRIYLEGTRHA